MSKRALEQLVGESYLVPAACDKRPSGTRWRCRRKIKWELDEATRLVKFTPVETFEAGAA